MSWSKPGLWSTDQIMSAGPTHSTMLSERDPPSVKFLIRGMRSKGGIRGRTAGRSSLKISYIGDYYSKHMLEVYSRSRILPPLPWEPRVLQLALSARYKMGNDPLTFEQACATLLRSMSRPYPSSDASIVQWQTVYVADPPPQ